MLKLAYLKSYLFRETYDYQASSFEEKPENKTVPGIVFTFVFVVTIYYNIRELHELYST